MPPWPGRSRRRRVSRRGGPAAGKTTSRRAGGAATATTSSYQSAKSGARADRLMSAAGMEPSVAAASARRGPVDRLLAAPPMSPARSIRTAARTSVDASRSSRAPRAAPAATRPARRPMAAAPSMPTVVPKAAPPVLTMNQQAPASPLDQAKGRPVRVAAANDNSGARAGYRRFFASLTRRAMAICSVPDAAIGA